MKNELFRKNSLDNLSSPEQLNECIKTSYTSIWVIFISVVLLIAGLIIWAFAGSVDITVHSIVVCEDNKAVIYIPEKNIDNVSENADVCIDGKSIYFRGCV